MEKEKEEAAAEFQFLLVFNKIPKKKNPSNLKSLLRKFTCTMVCQ